VISGAGASRSN